MKSRDPSPAQSENKAGGFSSFPNRQRREILEEPEKKYKLRLPRPLSLDTAKHKEPQASAPACKSTQYQAFLQTPQRAGPPKTPPDLNTTIASDQHTRNTVFSIQSLTQPRGLRLHRQDTPVGIWASQQALLYADKATEGFMVKQVLQGSGREHLQVAEGIKRGEKVLIPWEAQHEAGPAACLAQRHPQRPAQEFNPSQCQHLPAARSPMAEHHAMSHDTSAMSYFHVGVWSWATAFFTSHPPSSAGSNSVQGILPPSGLSTLSRHQIISHMLPPRKLMGCKRL